MKINVTLAAALIALASVASAQPSNYFVWVNKATGQKVCEPDMPADKWTRESGPYEDENCKFKLPT